MMMAGQINGVLNSYKRFAVAAFSPIYNICTILSISILGKRVPNLPPGELLQDGYSFSSSLVELQAF